MTLREALKSRGDDEETIEHVIDDMIKDVENGISPDEVLHGEGLEPDYVIDLLDEMT